jgi:Ca-activated chloride channel family protein
VVLASDGLDASRAMAEQIAHDASARGVTISSMGIGLDFDEGYMGGVAVAGHGNFAFVKDGASLATFLHRELEETANTMAENVTARVRLPDGTRFVRAMGGDGRIGPGGDLEISVGSLFGGDERRVIIELTMSVPSGQSRGFEGAVSWSAVGGDTSTARFGGLSVSGVDDAIAVEQGRDGAVFANATSVLASVRQIEAAEAYERGDSARAQALTDQNLHELQAAASAAPAAAAPALMEQSRTYADSKRAFAAPPSPKAAAAAKAGAARDFDNVSRKGYK